VGKPERTPAECRGPKGSFQVGYLVGGAHFRTERGFAQIRLHRIPAGRESWGHQVCEFNGPLVFGHPKQKRTRFSAIESVVPHLFAPPKKVLSFRATQFYRHARPADRRVEFTAELQQSAGRISIHRKVSAVASERSLLFPGAPSAPEEIDVKPPAPFTGSGEFLRTRESTFTWTGDLTVPFPGLDPIRLTGKRFAVTICALKHCLANAASDS
jgi:hypothetical protein